MLIEAGFEIAFECPAATPMILQLSIHPSRDADLLTPDRIVSDPSLPMRSYLDLLGNWVTRVEVPAGPSPSPTASSFRTRASRTNHHPTCGRRRSPSFPTKRCCSCSRAAIAIATSSLIRLVAVRKAVRRPVCAGDLRFRSREDLVQLSRRQPNSLRRRFYARRHRRLPGLRHLALALCRCMNIPARYCTGYLGDIGVPIDVNPMDFSAWFEVFLAGRWYTMDARHNHPRIGRIVMGRGRDAADVAMSTAFGVANLMRFEVVTQERVEHD